MASSASTLAKVELQGAGDNPGTWHTVLNDLIQQHEEDYRGSTSVAMSNTDVTLTDTQYVSNQARNMIINITGTATANHSIIVPDRKKAYVVNNQGDPGAFTVTFKASGGTGFTLTKNTRYIVQMDGAGRATVLLRSPSIPYVVTSGQNAYTANLEQTPDAFRAGMEFKLNFNTANSTTAVTIAFNNQTAISIYQNGTTVIPAGGITSGMTGLLVLDSATTGQLFFPTLASTLGLTNGGVQTTGFTAAVNTKYTAAFTANGTITLPAAATAGDTIVLALGGFYSYTLAPNGLKINGSTSNLILLGNQTVVLVYTGATDGWV